MSTDKDGKTDNCFGSNLRLLRKTIKSTQGDFAKPLTITGGYVSDLERGKARPSQAVLNEIISVYKVNPNFLEMGDGDMFTEEVEQEVLHLAEDHPATHSLERITNQQFKTTCAANFEHVFEFISDKYGQDGVGIQMFLDDLLEVHHPYRVWLFEKKQERKNHKTERHDNLAANDK